MSAIITADPEQPDFKRLWEEALNSFKDKTGIDLKNRDLLQRLDDCKNVDDALRAIEDTESAVHYSRNGNKWMKMRELLKPVVQVAVVFMETGAEAAASLSVPGGKAILAAVSVVLKATQKMSDRFDALIKLFKKLAHSLGCFKIRIGVPFTDQSLHITVEILITLLNAIAHATKMMNESRIRQFAKVLFTGDNYISEALENLNRLVTEQSQIIEAETLKVAYGTQVAVKSMHDILLVLQQDRAFQERNYTIHCQILALQEQNNALLKQNNALLKQNLVLSNQTSTIIYLPLPDLRSILSFLWCSMHYFASLSDNAWGVIKPTLTINIGDADSNASALTVHLCDVFSIMAAIGWLFISGMMSMLPPEMNFPSTKNTIILIDALGYQVRLPLERCRTYEDFHELLLEIFSNKKAKALRFVKSHAYEITNTGSSMIIDRVAWPKAVRQGVNLEMGIILRQMQLMCPWCKTPSIQAGDGQVMKCPCCHRECIAGTNSNLSLIEEIEDDKPVRETQSVDRKSINNVGSDSFRSNDAGGNEHQRRVSSDDLDHTRSNDLDHSMPGSFLHADELSMTEMKIVDPQDMNDFRKIRVIYNPLGELPSPIQEILAFCPQILVVGKSGVGKSSLVSSVFNIDKKITDVQHQQAGTADIEREITFSSNDCFILYDSQGFEPGSDESLSTATKFISDRCDDSKELKDRLHAIWLCLETPRPGSRLLQSGDEKILEVATERKGLEVAVIIVFTKFDYLVNEYFQKIQSSDEFSENVEEHATYMAKKDLQEKFDNLLAHKYPKIRFVPVFADEPDEYEDEDDVNSHSGGVNLNHGSLNSLTDATLDMIGKSRILWIMAQQINAKQKVELYIGSGIKWYWGDLAANTMSLNTTLFGCLMRIYDDIISVWNLNDPEESLASVDFNTKMFNLIKPLLQKPEQPPRDIAEKTNELADLAARIRPGLEKAVAYAGLAGVAASILIDRIRATPVTALCLGAYVVDLTLILHRLFLTNSPPRAVSKELVLETFRVYQESCAEVHDRIRKIAYSATFRPKEFSKEIEALIKTELKM